MDCIMNPIAQNKIRPKPCLIFSHYIFFFISGTKTLAYVVTCSALCTHCWHLYPLSPQCVSQHSQSLTTETACLFATSSLSFPSVIFPHKLYSAYCITFWQLIDSSCISLFTPAPPGCFLLIVSSC